MATTRLVKYERSTDYRTVAATGAFGGPAPNGEIVFDLFVERFSVPESENLIIDGLGIMQAPTPIETPILREAQVGVVMRPDIAFALGLFLMEKAQQAGFRPPLDDEKGQIK